MIEDLPVLNAATARAGRHASRWGSSANGSDVLPGDYLVSPATNPHLDLATTRACARARATLDRSAPLCGPGVCTGMGTNSRTAIRAGRRTGKRTGGQIELPEP
jgi:hypothetical protein